MRNEQSVSFETRSALMDVLENDNKVHFTIKGEENTVWRLGNYGTDWSPRWSLDCSDSENEDWQEWGEYNSFDYAIKVICSLGGAEETYFDNPFVCGF